MYLLADAIWVIGMTGVVDMTEEEDMTEAEDMTGGGEDMTVTGMADITMTGTEDTTKKINLLHAL